MSKIAILIDAELHNELVLRTRSNGDVTQYIEDQLFNFLERTEGDASMWGEEYSQEYWDKKDDKKYNKYGDPTKGYQWQTILLLNGSKLRMTYKGRNYYAEIQQGKIIFEHKEFTPATWARHIANNTSRNAWMDIFVQFPESSNWKCANMLRWEEKEKNS